MRKWLLVCVSFLSVYLLPSFFQTFAFDKTTYSFHSTVVGNQYGFYLDEECTKPIVNDNQEEIVLITDGTKNQTIELEDFDIYMKQIDSIDGYYIDSKVYALKPYTYLKAYPIQIEYTSDIYPCSYTLLNEQQEIVASWTSETPSIALQDEKAFLYEKGKTYVLVEQNPQMYSYAKDIQFTIPTTVNEHTKETISLTHSYYGVIELSIEEQQPIENATYALFLDGTCTQEAVDHFGNSSIQKTNSQGNLTWNLNAGMYYLKMIDIDQTYYLDETIYPIQVEERKREHIQIQATKPKIHIQMLNASNNEQLEASIQMQYGQDEMTVASGEYVEVSRDTTYRFIDNENVNGFYEAMEIEVHVPMYEEEIEAKMYREPFVVKFDVVDVDTRESILQGKYQIVDANNEAVLSISKLPLETSDLKCGTYTFLEVEAIQGYVSMQPINFTIGESKEETIVVRGTKQAYSLIRTSLLDGQDTIMGKVGLYEDASCSINAKDVFQQEIIDLTCDTYALKAGTYYYQVYDLDHKYYEMEIGTISIDHASFHKDLQIQAIPVQADIKIQYKQEDISNSSFDILYENQILYENIQTSNAIALNRDTTYQVKIHALPGTYTYSIKPQSLYIPKTQPGTLPNLILNCEPYTTVNIDDTQDSYSFYVDENCTTYAKDIYGTYTKEKAQWLLRDGTYYVKQSKCIPYYYADAQVYPIEISHKTSFTKDISFSQSPVQLEISLENEEGQLLQDGQYEILDENNTLITSFEGSTTLETFIEPNTTYTLHEKKTPNGYVPHALDIVYTLPKTKPNTVPTVIIRYQMQNNPIVKTTLKTDSHTIPIVVYGTVIGCFCIVGVLMKKFSKNVKCNKSD